jgi:hypothetical protein
VDFVALVSWLAPVELPRAAKRAAKQCRAALLKAAQPSTAQSASKCNAAVLCGALGLDHPLAAPLTPQSLWELLDKGAGGGRSGWSAAEARALLLKSSSQPGRLELDDEGLLRLARMQAYEPPGPGNGGSGGGVGSGGGGGGASVGSGHRRRGRAEGAAQDSSLAGAPSLGGSLRTSGAVSSAAAAAAAAEPMPTREEYLSGGSAEAGGGRRGGGSSGRPSSATSTRNSTKPSSESSDRASRDSGRDGSRDSSRDGGNGGGDSAPLEERPRRKSSKSNRLGPLSELRG